MMLMSLKRFLRHIWRRISAAPVALKVIGLVVLPLLLILIGGGLFVRDRLSLFSISLEHQPIVPELLSTLTRESLIVIGVGALVGLGLAVLLTWVLVRPLRTLVRAMRRVQAGDLSVEVPVWAHDEIGEVQAEFNAMVIALRESRRVLLRQQHDLETLNHEHARLLAEVRSKSERLQQLWSRAIAAQEAERKRLARELHDETGQALTSLSLQLKACRTRPIWTSSAIGSTGCAI